MQDRLASYRNSALARRCAAQKARLAALRPAKRSATGAARTRPLIIAAGQIPGPRPGRTASGCQAARRIQRPQAAAHPGWPGAGSPRFRHMSRSGIIDNMYFPINQQINNSAPVDGALTRWDPVAPSNGAGI